VKKNSKPRVAICLSGFMRNYKDRAGDWVNLIRSLNADVFISTWTTRGWRVKASIPSFMADGAEVDSKKINWGDVFKTYGAIKGLVVDDYEKFEPLFRKRAKQVYDARDEYNLRKDDQPKANLSMYYKIWSANRLKQNAEEAEGMKYDVVIKSRPDVSVDSIPQQCLKGSDVLWSQPHGKNPQEAGDLIFVSSSKTIDWMCSVHEQYDQMFRDAVKADNVADMNSVLQPHLLYSRHIKDGKIKIGCVYMGVDVL